MLRAYKTEIDPNDVQRTSLLRHAGAARWAYNFGLRRKEENYRAWVAGGKQGTCPSLSAIDLHRELNTLKKVSIEEGGVPWMYEVSKCAPQEALRNLDAAYSGFFRRCKSAAKQKGHPKYKSRKRGIGSFTLTGAVHVSKSSVQLPRLGELRLKEADYLPAENVKILRATCSEKAGRWFVSLQVEVEDGPAQSIPDHVVGVDVGILRLATTSDGTPFENPRALKQHEKRLRRLQKAVSRRQKGSCNRKKAVRKLGEQHYQVSCVRRDAIHKATTAISKQASVVVIEDLHVAGMMQNHRLARAIGDAGFAEFLRQIIYKMLWRGGRVVVADRWYPSSKTCSGCGHVKETLALSDRVFVCEACGLRIDRDLNAAINLRNLAGSSPVTACRPGSAGSDCKARTKLLVGQEPNTTVSREG